MTRHSSGISILCGPLDVADTAAITPEQISQLLAFLQQIYSFVIVDTGGQLFGVNAAVFLKSDLTFFNMVPNLPALKNVKRYLPAMEKCGVPMKRVKLVLNRYLPEGDIKTDDVEKVLGCAVFGTIPNEYREVSNSINKGTPVVKLYPDSDVTKAFFKLAELAFQSVSSETGD
jgi:pilus assembly protein CpaE